jgi:LPS-assembly lipoprotein
MSLPSPRALRRIAFGGLILSMAAISACTVRPLYSNAPLSAGSNVVPAEQLASIAVKPVTTRYAQQVRNNLIFGLTRGAGQPAVPAYSLDLGVTEQITTTVVNQAAKDQDQPVAGAVVLTATYRLTDAKTGKQISSGKRTMSASFDRPQQEYATYRAQIDAENRAARELAEILQLSIAQDLARHGG